jgi:hypothetical protein
MTDRIERLWAESEALGRANQVVIDLCRNHCLDMTFVQDGGGGAVEAQTGLPVNRRRISCPIAVSRTSGMNLEHLARDFYTAHCVGCAQRRPTGVVPNFASVIEGEEVGARAAEENKRARTAERHRAWSERVERRRALRVGVDPATASVLDDFGLLDIEPGREPDRDLQGAAIGRLTALAERTPHAFTAEAIEVAILLVEQDDVSGLLAPLRRIAHARPECAPLVLGAAFAALRHGPDLEAGRCVSDMLAAQAHEVDEKVVRALVLLAGAPDRESIGYLGPAVSPRDGSGLRAAASHAPNAVVAVLKSMLPPPYQPTSLVLLPGTPDPNAEREAGDFDRASAGTAVEMLAQTHPGLVTELIEAMVRNLGVEPEDLYDNHPVGCVQQALATLYLLDIGDVHAQVEALGRTAGSEHRDRLFGVLQNAARLLDPNDRFRASGAPSVDQQRRQAVFEQLISTSLTRAGCDWGSRIGTDAATLLASLADLDPALTYPHINALLGVFLTAVDRLNAKPAPSPIATDPASETVRALEAFAAVSATEAIARDLLSAISHASSIAPAAVCTMTVDLIANERDEERGAKAVARLLGLVGDLGTQHGDQPGILPKLLPLLHTYILDPEASLRAAALDAWTNIATHHPVPSSLSDLLPALTTDIHLGVIRELLDAACSLPWPQPQSDRLLTYAFALCQVLDASSQRELLLKAMWTVICLTDGDEQRRSAGEKLILNRAGQLDDYGLSEILRHAWLPASASSEQMAHLRLRHARESTNNSPLPDLRDAHWCALLDCGPGLSTLPNEDLIAAALEKDPRFPLASAHYAEVAWRAGRPADAATVMRAVAAGIPRQPAFAQQHGITNLLIAAAEFDAAEIDQLGVRAQELADAIGDLETDDSDYLTRLTRTIRAAASARLLLADQPIPTALQTSPRADAPTNSDPATCARTRAEQLAAAGTELDAAAQRFTATADYCRLIAAVCTIAQHLLGREAAELDADIATAQAHTNAANRRIRSLNEAVHARFTPDDPLAVPLLTALAAADKPLHGETSTLLTQFAKLNVPALVIQGPQQTATPDYAADQPPDDESPGHEVAVVLASLNGQLITGPTVVQPATAYSLNLEVHPGDWPDWADHLEGEILSHFTGREVETSTYRWAHPLDAKKVLHQDGTLVVRFGLNSGQPAPPFLINLHWSGTRDGQTLRQTLDVAGHRELRIRPYDASRDALVNSFPAFDERLLAIYEGLHSAGYNNDHIQAFCRLFTAICRAGLVMTWNKQYKRGTSVSERKFHDDLDAMLRSDPDLSGRVQRGTPLALGFLDVRHDGITAELKVERKTPVTKETAPKYLGQPTQYAAADGARLSILCVLDMSPKIAPIGTPENYVFTLQPALHGLTNPEAPSLTAVIIVNGNLPTPSSWSRRRVTLQPQSSNP